MTERAGFSRRCRGICLADLAQKGGGRMYAVSTLKKAGRIILYNSRGCKHSADGDPYSSSLIQQAGRGGCPGLRYPSTTRRRALPPCSPCRAAAKIGTQEADIAVPLDAA